MTRASINPQCPRCKVRHDPPMHKRDDDDLYVCPTTGETESRTMGGFDVCCDHPDCSATEGPATVTLTDEERQSLPGAYSHPTFLYAAVERIVAARVVEALTADNAGWRATVNVERARADELILSSLLLRVRG